WIGNNASANRGCIPQGATATASPRRADCTRRDNSSAAVYSTSAGDVAGCSRVGQNSVSSVSYTGDRKVTCSLHICIEPAHHESRGTHRDGDRTATGRQIGRAHV